MLKIFLSIQDTSDDIRRYLYYSVPDSTADKMKDLFANIMLTAAMATEVEGSFLWASSMLEDLKMRADDADDLLKLASEGLPEKMSDLYDRVIARIKQKDGGSKTLPLWK